MSDTKNTSNGSPPAARQVLAKDSLRAPLPKRFYKTASVAERKDGFAIELDGKGIKTPAKKDLVLPTRALADAIAAEWAAQKDRIDPDTMPLTRIANTAIDAVAGHMHEVAADVVAFAGNDLLCYRATAPEALAARQKARWDPVLDWARDVLGATLERTVGVTHVAQPPAALAGIESAVRELDPFRLAALHVMTTLTGSALLALAHARGLLDLAEAWSLAHIDEDWQIEQWGRDEEAAARRAKRFAEFEAASRLLNLLA